MSQTKAQLIDTLVASLLPASDSSVDIGSNAVRFANIYGDTLYGSGANLTGLNIVTDTSPQLGGNLDVNTKNILFGDSASASDDRLIFGAGSDLSIYHDSSTNDSFIKESGSGAFKICSNLFRVNNAANSEVMLSAAENGAVELYYDTVKKFETTSAGVSVTGGLTASGASTFNEDVTFIGDTTHLTWDRSNRTLQAQDNAKIKFGTSGDLQIYHDGSTNIIDAATSNAISFRRGNTEQFFIGDAEFKGGDNKKIKLGTGDDLQIYHDGSHSYLNNLTGSLQVQDAGSEKFRVSGTGTFFKDDIFISNDNDKINLGAGNDLQIYHDGSHSYIEDAGTGKLRLKTGGFLVQTTTDETMIQGLQNNQVELYYDNSKKLETTSGGITVTGGITPTGNITFADSSGGGNNRIIFGGGADLQLWHDGSNSFIADEGTGNLKVLTNKLELLNAANNEYLAVATENAAVELYYDNSKKFETTSAGIDVTGRVTTDELTVEKASGNLSTIINAQNGLGTIEIGGSTGAFIDLKTPNSDDYDLRVNSDGVLTSVGNIDLVVNANENGVRVLANGAVQLFHDNTQRFTTSTAGVGMVQGGDKFTWPASSGAGPELFNAGSSNRDLDFNIDNEHKYRFHQNGILYQKGANSSNGGAYSSPSASYPVRVWLSFNDEDNITNGHGGVSSVSDTGTGSFTINFSNTWPDDNYAMAATSGGAGGSRGDDSCITHGATNPGTGSIGIRTRKFTDNNFTNSESAMFVFVR